MKQLRSANADLFYFMLSATQVPARYHDLKVALAGRIEMGVEYKNYSLSSCTRFARNFNFKKGYCGFEGNVPDNTESSTERLKMRFRAII